DASSPKFQYPVAYHFRTGGKRMRATLVLLACAACGGRIEDGMNPAALVEMIHNYSLVMDDLIDRGVVRRGKPTVRVKFGDSVALLIAMLYREALDDLIEKCISPTKTRMVAVKAMKDIIEGERLDMTLEQAGREDPYLKTQRVLSPNFALYLEMIGKKIGKDVIEHKLGNAAILTALRYLPRNKKSEIFTTLRSEKVSQAMVMRARRLVMETPAEKDCREIAAKYLHEAKAHLSVLGK